MASVRAGWIASQQYQSVHPYTNSPPGPWAWTHLPGGVPDADDTAGAIIAMTQLSPSSSIGNSAACHWLLNLQNSDGGWPTFCRGWGHLPFDKSSPDLTAHALRALHCATGCDSSLAEACRRATANGLRYLHASQQPDGSWVPLWFGNQFAPRHANPVLGTARVLLAIHELGQSLPNTAAAVQYLLRAQNADGGWGGAASVASSVEETALTVSALACFHTEDAVQLALAQGVGYLVQCVEQGSVERATPIGLYFASLWYSERFYPLIWTLDALGRVESLGTGNLGRETV